MSADDDQHAEFVAECVERAARAELPARGTFADEVLDAVLNAPRLVRSLIDVGCGSVPHLGLRWRSLGYEGPLVFLDWMPQALIKHRLAFEQCAYHANLVPAGDTWRHMPVQLDRLDGAWLTIHRTLPRWPAADGVHKPRGAADGAALLRELAGTGAIGLSTLLAPVEHDTLLAGATALKWAHSTEEGVTSADFERNELFPSFHILFPSR